MANVLPWQPVQFTEADVHALKSMAQGAANAAQQVRVLEFIVKDLCETDGLSFRPDDMGGALASSFAEGKRHVGLQLRKIILMPLNERGELKGA